MPENRIFQSTTFVCSFCRNRVAGYPVKRDPTGQAVCRRCYDRNPGRVRYFRQYRENNPNQREKYDIKYQIKDA